MKLYNILLLLHGEITNQVRKEMVTAAEIQLLRSMHQGNNDAVQDIVCVGETNRSDAAERRRLANVYSPDPFSLDNEVAQAGMVLVTRMFGPEGVPLPQEVPPQFMDEGEDYVPEDEIITLADGTVKRFRNGEEVTEDGAKPAAPTANPAALIQAPTTADNPFADEGHAVAAVPEPVAPRRASPLRARAELGA